MLKFPANWSPRCFLFSGCAISTAAVALFTPEFSMTFRHSESGFWGVVSVLVSQAIDGSWMVQVCSEKEEDNSL